jgi:hypothetical protein
MNWIPRYIWKLAVWSFNRWRIHLPLVTVIVGGLFIVGWLIGVRISWLNTTTQIIAAYLVVWLVILTLVVAPACLWHELELQLADQPRPWVIIDRYDPYIEVDETGKEYLAGTLHIVNRGKAPAINIEIPRIQYRNRTANLLSPLPTSLGPDQSIDAQILNLEYVLKEINRDTPKVRGRSWSVRRPLTVEYYDLNHVRWTTDHAITFNARGISIDIVHPNEPQEWTNVSSSKD